jgi:DNA-binding CsgD family transcriptional regulator
MAIVQKDLVVVWANPVVHGMVAQGVHIADGRLSIGNRETTESLHRFVEDLDASPAGWATFVSPGEHLVIRADLAVPPDLPPAAVLTFQLTSQASSHLVWADLRKALGLTRSEAAIVEQLLEGHGAEDIAAHSPVTLETVRTHIRRIYHKLGVGSREQLFAKLLQFRVG